VRERGRRACFFAAGESAGGENKIPDVKRFCRCLGAFACRKRKLVEAVADILSPTERCGKSASDSKDVGQLAALRGRERLPAAVEEFYFAQADFPRVGPLQACNAIDAAWICEPEGPKRDGEASRTRIVGHSSAKVACVWERNRLRI